jgi:hypothetical protein
LLFLLVLLGRICDYINIGASGDNEPHYTYAAVIIGGTMNLFYFHHEPDINARMHCDKHVVKMPLEVAQLLSTAVRVLVHASGMQIDLTGVYKQTHVNHPCAVWTRSSVLAFDSVVEYGEALCMEYTYRYGREHASQEVIELCSALDDFYTLTYTEPMPSLPQMMPEQYKVPGDPVAAYRAYFNGEKQHIAKWTNRPAPEWFVKAGVSA